MAAVLHTHATCFPGLRWPQPRLHLSFLGVSLRGWSTHLLLGAMANYCMHANVGRLLWVNMLQVDLLR